MCVNPKYGSYISNKETTKSMRAKAGTSNTNSGSACSKQIKDASIIGR